MKIYEIVVENEDRSWSEGLFKTYELGLNYLRQLFAQKETLVDIKKKWTSEDSFISELGLSVTYYDLVEREVKE